jgi:hypothetical protein
MDDRTNDTAEITSTEVKSIDDNFGGFTPQRAIELRDTVQPGERVPVMNMHKSGELLIYERTKFKSCLYDFPKEWDGTSEDDSWFTESKSEKEYYIYTVSELMSFRQMVNMGHSFRDITIHLGDNINLNKINWQPIGTNLHPFRGTFNGDGHCIHNLNIGQIYDNIDELDNYGFFGCTENATIRDIVFDSARVIDNRGGLYGIAVVAGTAKTTSFSCISVSGLIMGNILGSIAVYADNSDFDRCVNRAKFHSISIAKSDKYVCGGITAYAKLSNYICPYPMVYFPLFDRCIQEGYVTFDSKAASLEVSAGQLYGEFIGGDDISDAKFSINNCTILPVNTAERKTRIPTYNGINSVFKQRLEYGRIYKTDMLDGYLGRTPYEVEILVARAVLETADGHIDASTNIASLKSGHKSTGFITSDIFDITSSETATEFLYPYYRFVNAIQSNNK